MYTTISQLSPFVIAAYGFLLFIALGCLLVFLRYCYIVFFYRNKYYHLGYQRGVLGLKNSGEAIKNEVFEESKHTGIKEKIALIKMKLKELVIEPEIRQIEKKIHLFQAKIEEIKDFRKNAFLKLEEDTLSGVMETITKLLGDNNLEGLKQVIAEFSDYVDDLNIRIKENNIPTIYEKIGKKLGEHTNEYVEHKSQILREIDDLKSKIPDIESQLLSIQNKKIDLENKKIKSLTFSSKTDTSISESLKNDFSFFGIGIVLIIVIIILLSLFLGDFLVMYQWMADKFVREISQNQKFAGVIPYEMFAVIIGMFFPVLFFGIFEILRYKANRGSMLGKILKYFGILISVLSLGIGFVLMFKNQIFGGEDDIMVTLRFFLLPAALTVAYGLQWIDESETGFKPVGIALSIPFKLIYIFWKYIQTRFALAKQVRILNNDKSNIHTEIAEKEKSLEGKQEERDLKILSEVKGCIDLEGGIERIQQSINNLGFAGQAAGEGVQISEAIVQSFKKEFDAIRKSRSRDVGKLTKKLDGMRKNIDDINEGFEGAINQKLVIS